MRINVNNSTELLQLTKEQKLLGQLQKQIKKDFISANVPLQIPTDVELKAYVSIIMEKVYVLLMERFPDYLNLLYVIDVPERDFKHIKITDTVEVAAQVTFLILKREYQKVWYKNTYQ
ncbi:hypothetical protein SAMN04488009_0783 [Maribacter sedimenticola]|uniref:Uncharacterized protein n=1 Tax=Maribacter sedimenticola TaxID=228956 RepID=A0ABY1SDD2_9FLAO|nr:MULTISPECIES: hypothetical protein [Maribacter]TVZ16671.1 hypothetical protein JM81_2937 [Maribacter sp. MAR_2009_72]SNR28394.1 hypothetical protein SAMN04488009_0783 [Maribacter sedimenticola]